MSRLVTMHREKHSRPNLLQEKWRSGAVAGGFYMKEQAQVKVQVGMQEQWEEQVSRLTHL